MIHYLRNFIITFSVFMTIDLIWIGFIARKFYKAQLGFIMTENVNWTAAVIFYVIFIVGMLYFATYPSLETGSAFKALLIGAFFGLITYATYDLTNLATLKNWPLFITIMDILWGMFLCGFTNLISFLIIKRL